MNRCTYCGSDIKKYVKKRNELITDRGEKVKYCSVECKEKLEAHYRRENFFKRLNIVKIVVGLLALISLVLYSEKLWLAQIGVGLVALMSLAYPSAGYNQVRGKTMESYIRSSRVSSAIVIVLIVTWCGLYFGKVI